MKKLKMKEVSNKSTEISRNYFQTYLVFYLLIHTITIS